MVVPVCSQTPLQPSAQLWIVQRPKLEELDEVAHRIIMPTEGNTLSTEELHILNDLQKHSPVLSFVPSMCIGQRFTNVMYSPGQDDHYLNRFLMAFTQFVSTKPLCGILPVGKSLL